MALGTARGAFLPLALVGAVPLSGVHVSKLAAYKSRTMAAVRESRTAVRSTVSTVETIGGAALAGYVDATFPDGLAGLPASATAGLLLVGAGWGMKQADMKALGVGMLAGYAYAQGASMAQPQ